MNCRRCALTLLVNGTRCALGQGEGWVVVTLLHANYDSFIAFRLKRFVLRAV